MRNSKPIVGPGATVVMMHSKHGKMTCLLGHREDVEPGTICINCAAEIARAMIGKRLGDEVKITAKNGDVAKIKILEIVEPKQKANAA